MCEHYPVCKAAGRGCTFEITTKEENELLPYEVHITIEQPCDVEKLREECNSFGIKIIMLDLINSGTVVMNDLMTSWVLKEHKYDIVKFKADWIAIILGQKGFKVKRIKIETVPWHPDAQTATGVNYFESHLAFKLTKYQEERLRSVASIYKLHISKNKFKQHEGEISTIMATYREYNTTRTHFEKYVEFLKSDLGQYFELEKVITEYAIYDSDIHHDAKWVN